MIYSFKVLHINGKDNKNQIKRLLVISKFEMDWIFLMMIDMKYFNDKSK